MKETLRVRMTLVEFAEMTAREIGRRLCPDAPVVAVSGNTVEIVFAVDGEPGTPAHGTAPHAMDWKLLPRNPEA